MTDTITTFNGLLSQKPTSQKPRAGEQRWLSWETRISKKGKEWLKVKNDDQEHGGRLCEIINAEQTDFTDAHGNVSFNVEFSPISGGNGRGAQPATAAGTEEKNVSHPANTQNGISDTRRELMRAANLYNLVLDCVNSVSGPHVKSLGDGSLLNPEMFQCVVGQLFKYMCSRRTTDGVNWWSYVDKMPDKPIGNHK